MRYPFRFVDLRPLAVFVCFGSVWSAGAASERLAEALREKLPRYDPAQHAAAERKAQAAENDSAAPSPVRVPQPAETPPRREPLVTNPNVVQLEPFTVRERRPKPTVQLPRLTVPEALRPGEDTTDPYLSPAERARRVRKKHLNAVATLLNPGFFGDAIAEQAEARERYAGKLGDLADQLELAAATGATAEEIRQLRELYLALYMARPK